MKPIFVRIGDRYINVNAILWAQVDLVSNPHGIALFFNAEDGGTIHLQGQEADQMRGTLDQFRPSNL